MKNTLIMIVTRGGISPQTLACLDKLEHCHLATVVGVSDVSHARCIAFDTIIDTFARHPELDIALTLDDDMVWREGALQQIVNIARASGVPTSGIALAGDGRPVAHPYQSPIVTPRQRWLTGLACMAFPRAVLESHATKLQRLKDGRRVWCRSGPHPQIPDQWVSEDIWLCLELGGVELAPIPIGHVKPVPLWPDDRTIEGFFAAARRIVE